MYLLKILKSILFEKRVFICMYALNTAILTFFCYLLSWDKDALYAIVLSVFIFVVYLIYNCYIYKEFQSNLKNAELSPDYIVDCKSDLDEEIFETIKNIHRNYNEKLYKLRKHENDKDNIFSTHIHNMKTSITIIDLAASRASEEDPDNKRLKDIKTENEILSRNLEEGLNILRLEEFETDYVTKKIVLKDFIRGIINSNKKQFIYNEIFPVVDIIDGLNIHTDEKWCSYMINQIISNAIKYSNKKNDKKIYITAKDAGHNIILSIKDEGVGIPREDLDRVFYPFYTGKNGRDNRQSSGVGLYMVKSISDKLHHKLELKSKEGVGTEFLIYFNKVEYLS